MRDPSFAFGTVVSLSTIRNHQAAFRAQPVPLARLNPNPEQRSLSWIGRECADRDRQRPVEIVILHDDRGSRFSGVVSPSGNRPDLAPLHASARSETASMNS